MLMNQHEKVVVNDSHKITYDNHLWTFKNPTAVIHHPGIDSPGKELSSKQF